MEFAPASPSRVSKARMREAVRLAKRLQIAPEEICKRWTNGERWCRHHGWLLRAQPLPRKCPSCGRLPVTRRLELQKQRPL